MRRRVGGYGGEARGKAVAGTGFAVPAHARAIITPTTRHTLRPPGTRGERGNITSARRPSMVCTKRCLVRRSQQLPTAPRLSTDAPTAPADDEAYPTRAEPGGRWSSDEAHGWRRGSKAGAKRSVQPSTLEPWGQGPGESTTRAHAAGLSCVFSRAPQQ